MSADTFTGSMDRGAFLKTGLAAGMAVVGSTALVDSIMASAAARGLRKKNLVIGWTPPDVTGVFKTATNYFQISAHQFRKAGLNVQVVTQSLAVHTQFARQVDILENFIQRKVDAIAISPADVPPIIPALKRANAAGIPVIVVNLLEPIKGVRVASYVGFDNTEAAEVSAYATLNYFGGPGPLHSKWGGNTIVRPAPKVHLDLAWWRKLYASVKPGDPKIHGKVAVIEGIAGTFFSVKRVQGFHNVVDKFPGVKIVADLPADWNRAKGTAAAENILSAHPDLDAIWAASNEMGLGAMNVVYANAKQNQIKVLTNDGTPESVQRIREGKLLAETWHGFPEWGWYGGAYAVMAALGETPPHIFNIDPRTEYADNADQFYPHPHLGAIDFKAIVAHATK